MKLKFFNNCVGWPARDVNAEGGLCDLISECRQITRETFLRHVDREDRKAVERGLGYGPDFPMSRDWHVGYYRSKLHGRRVYLFKHSAIEYVFA